MYKGEVNVAQNDIQSFLELAQQLEVQGLEVGPVNDTNKDKVTFLYYLFCFIEHWI